MKRTSPKTFALATALLLSVQYAFCQDPALQEMVAGTADKYVQRVYNDAETGKTMEYNLFIPKDYDKDGNYPLMMFIGDASTAGKEVTYPLHHCIGALIWATSTNCKPCATGSSPKRCTDHIGGEKIPHEDKLRGDRRNYSLSNTEINSWRVMPRHLMAFLTMNSGIGSLCV